MTFIEQRLELGLNYGASYGPRFNTAIATASNGVEQRRAIWSQPLITIQLGDRRVNQSELDYLLAFHASTKGAFAGFRIRDWSDYRSGLTVIGTGDGTAQTWQLVKRYTVAGVTVTRPITKPIDGTLTVYLDGVAVLSGWSCDYTTGVLSTQLTGAIAVDFQFDVPVRFEQDKIDFTYEAGKGNRKLFTLAPLTCVELRIEPTIYPPLDAIPSEIVETFDLGYDFGTLGGPSFNTAIATNAAEFESRKSYWENAKGSWDVGDRALVRSELDYFIALFRCARGMAVPFYFKDWQDEVSKKVRFAEDRISFRFDAFRSTDEEVIFNLGGVAISETLPMPPPICQPASYTFIDSLSSFVNWSLFSESGSGDWNIDVVINSSKWRVTTQFESKPISQLWISTFNYTPQSADEIISFSFSMSAQLISATPSGSGQLFNFFLIQNGSPTSGGFQELSSTSPTTITRSGTLQALGGNLIVGTPIYLAIGFGNSTGSTPAWIRVADYWDFTCTIDVTCS